MSLQTVNENSQATQESLAKDADRPSIASEEALGNCSASPESSGVPSMYGIRYAPQETKDQPASADPRPDIRSHRSTPAYWVAERHDIEAVDRSRPINMVRVCVELWDRRDEDEASLILTTNNDSFSFVAKVIEAEFGKRFCILGILDRADSPSPTSVEIAIAA